MRFKPASLKATASMKGAGLVLVVLGALCPGLSDAESKAITKCDWDESICGCKTDKGDINLSKYRNSPLRVKAGDYFYNWNPCKDLTIQKTISACIQSTAISAFDCGIHQSTRTSVQGGEAVFHLDAKDRVRHSQIKCKCGGGGEFQFVKESPLGTYDLVLSDRSCCPGAGSGQEGATGLSVGSILLIVLLVLVIVYLVGGVILQVGVRKAEGKERMPNVGFWTAIPGLIRDGIRFTFSCGKSTTYDQI